MPAFEREQPRTPASIGQIVVILEDHLGDGETGPGQLAHYQIEILDSQGQRVVRRGELTRHLAPGQVNALRNFLTSLRAQAQQEIIGG